MSTETKKSYKRKDQKSWSVDVDDEDGNPIDYTNFDRLKDAMAQVERMVRKGHRVQVEVCPI
jgi:hypothetical protein